ncbi:MAG: hypothetical protein Q9215_001675 [Flavoplaca cf. flavocitrina]
MSDLDATTPRVFLVRHGETEWTKNGRYTGVTDLELSHAGVNQVTATGTQLVGAGKLIDSANIARTWVSPRKRAQQTCQLVFSGDDDIANRLIVTEDIAEWDYGNYEGLVVGEIRARRKEKGLDGEREWNIWRDGCEGGESADQVTERLDRLIAQIRKMQAPYMNGEKPADVVVVAHGLILRCFAKRWLNYSLDNPLPMMLAPGAIGILRWVIAFLLQSRID